MVTTLPELVLARFLQGVGGAALVPLSQAVLFDINEPKDFPRAMAIWAGAAQVGSIGGPALGGWLTENYSWRYVFYINLPIGVLTFIGLWRYLPARPGKPAARLDWLGFLTLSVAIGSFQVMLDRGEQLDWFSSGEIIIESLIAASSFYLFLAHTFTAQRPFIRPALFTNRNFTGGVVLVFVVGMTYFASLALQPPYLQSLMGYPVVTAGLVMGPRGVGTMAAMLLVGRLIGRLDIRLLLGIGLVLTVWSFQRMSHWVPDISQSEIVIVGIVQGIGLGFLFTPLSVAALSGLSAELRTEGAGIFSLGRNIGSSIGISVVGTLLTRNTQANHADIAAYVNPTNPILSEPAYSRFFDPLIASGRAAIDSVVTQQAQVIAYIDDYRLLMIATLLLFPLLFLFQRSRPGHVEVVLE
jgi:DHA2 family multidrug resistance protein